MLRVLSVQPVLVLKAPQLWPGGLPLAPALDWSLWPYLPSASCRRPASSLPLISCLLCRAFTLGREPGCGSPELTAQRVPRACTGQGLGLTAASACPPFSWTQGLNMENPAGKLGKALKVGLETKKQLFIKFLISWYVQSAHTP